MFCLDCGTYVQNHMCHIPKDLIHCPSMKPVPIGHLLRGADTTAALQVSARHIGTL